MKHFLFAVAALSLVACGTHIDAGHVGVVVNSCSGGGIQPTPVGVGYHSVGACTDIIEFPTYQQTLVLTKSPTEGHAEDESIDINSSQSMAVNTDVSLSFTIDPAAAPRIYGKFKQDIEHIEYGYIRQSVRAAMQDAFGKYTAEQILAEKREAGRVEAEKLLTERLKQDGFIVTQFTVNAIRPPDQIVQAIQAKVAMVQEAERAQQEVVKAQAVAQQQVATAQGEAQKEIALAEGRAKAILTQAEAQAKANKILSESLTPELIEYRKIDKWNGTLPQFAGSATPLITFSK